MHSEPNLVILRTALGIEDTIAIIFDLSFSVRASIAKDVNKNFTKKRL